MPSKKQVPDAGKRVPTVLIVEDEGLLRVALSHYLQECGFNVLEAVNGEEAIQILEKSGIAIDVVFSDVRMPGAVDGFALAQWVRRHRPGMAVILTSGDGKKAQAAIELCGNEPFFAKPYDLAAVVRRIREIVDGAER